MRGAYRRRSAFATAGLPAVRATLDLNELIGRFVGFLGDEPEKTKETKFDPILKKDLVFFY